MSYLRTPVWINQFLHPFKKFEEIPTSVFENINADLEKIQSAKPVVSIVVIAWNEEINILNCVASLSKMSKDIPFEIIVVNNNSSDNTQRTIDQLHVRSFVELKQGAGPARQKGQVEALGKYILTADADCIYPSCWLNEMISVLEKKNVVCVYGRYSFISDSDFPRWKLSILEQMKDIMAEIRHVKQPYFNTFGISMGYVKEYGLKIGFIDVNRRGEDGQLCLELMKFGEIRQVRSNKARVWTGARTLQQSGSFFNIILSRVKEDMKRFRYNFISRK